MSRFSTMPDASSLTAVLQSVFEDQGLPSYQLSILDRQINPYTGNSRSEIVTCHCADQGQVRVLLKYDVHKSGPDSETAYEASVYRDLLWPMGTSTPRFFGSHTEPTGRTWLILEYLEPAVSLADLGDSDSMCLAARWLGQFHFACDCRLNQAPIPFLKTCDVNFYLRCGRQALLFANGSGQAAWLSALCQRAGAFLTPLWKPTVSHGDYYVHNILFSNDTVYPIDWEHAASDLGEMDLACLLDGWPSDIEHTCELEYQRSRWPDGAPVDFAERVSAARLCLFLHNLNSRPDWMVQPKGIWYSECLQRLGAQLGLI